MSETIADFFAARGEPTRASANLPLPLLDPMAVWLVTKGHIDVVAMTIAREEGSPDMQRTHLLRIEEGGLLFGFRMPGTGHNMLLLGFGSADAELSRIDLQELIQGSTDPEGRANLAPLVDQWVSRLCNICSHDQPPTGTLNLRADAECALLEGQSAQPQSGVLWVSPSRGAAAFLRSEEEGGASDEGVIVGEMFFPVSKDAWVTGCTQECVLRGHTSADIASVAGFWRGLQAFHETVDAIIDLQRRRDRQSGKQRLITKSRASRSTVAAAVAELRSVLGRRDGLDRGVEAGLASISTGEGEQSALLQCCRLVGARLGIDIKNPDDAIHSPAGVLARARRGDVNPLERIARHSRFALRRVQLRSGWHREDAGPLLGFMSDTEGEDGPQRPVALLPASSTSYELRSANGQPPTLVTSRVAERIAPAAFAFYRTLPDRPVTGFDLARFAVRGIGRDLLVVAVVAALGSMLTFVTPLAVAHVFDMIIPWAERGHLAQLTLGLLIAAFAAGAFRVTRNIALIRVQYRAGSQLQAAVWERTINLPAKFFSQYSSGDLAVRAMAADSIRDELGSGTITTIVTGVFSLIGLFLLFYYSPVTALAALGLIGVAVGVTVLAGLTQLRYQRQLEESHGRIAALLLQLLNGIAKIRVAAAEDRAFSQWAVRFAHQRRLDVRSRMISNNLSVFNSAFPIIAYLIIFWLIADQLIGPGGGLSTGAFLAFLSAFAIVLFGMISLGSTLVGMLNVLPLYSRLKPILEAQPEVDETRHDPGPLRGRIEVSSVSFRYIKEGPLVLDSVSLQAEPGEFIAIVGASGSGKSTLLRILLGFEEPEAGSIAYDGFDAGGLDPRAVRRQFGVVLQDGDLMPGDVFTNIVGSAVDLTLADAWEAAEAAGLKRDIDEMPMGMHTVIAEGAGTLSGGQRQRLMIARSLVTKPRIVFFDEATSALDNPTQAVVTESLDRLRATRIVIAHRLSTIVGADRIYVMDDGRIVQSGTYDELMNQSGMFQELVKRQIA